MITKGIDVSKHQGDINWTNVKKAGVQFAILRAGYGKEKSQKDVQFENNYAGCAENGIPCGAYWYSYATTVDGAKREAETCISLLKGKKFEYPIWYDMEESAQFALGKDECTAIAKAFLETMENAGYFVGIYSFKHALEKYFDESLREKYAVWVAHIDVNETDYSGDYGMWQYCWTGAVRGIKGDVDMDYCYVDYPAAIKAKGLGGFSKSSETSQNAPESTKNEKPKTNKGKAQTALRSGNKAVLNDSDVYASATAKDSSGKKSGTFYVYSDDAQNGRIRITNAAENVGKKPAQDYVTGWVKLADIGKKTETYTVKKGDTLSEIAEEFDTTVNEIAKDNGIKDPDKIREGQKLKID